MATALKNLSDYDPTKVPSAKDMRFAIVVSEWNSDITMSLLEGTDLGAIGVDHSNSGACQRDWHREQRFSGL